MYKFHIYVKIYLHSFLYMPIAQAYNSMEA